MKPFVTTWTKLETFEKCSWLFYLQYGSQHLEGDAKLPFVTNEWLEKGNEIHEELEDALTRLKLNSQATNYGRKHWKPWWTSLVHNLVKKYPQFFVEHKIGIDTNLRGWALNDYWQPDKAVFKDNTMWLRGKMDFIGFDKNPFNNPQHASIIDWKSGKYRPGTPGEYAQLAFYAFMLFCYWPSVETVNASLYFVDFPKPLHKPYTEKYSRKEHFKPLKKEFTRRVEVLNTHLEHNTFPQAKTCHHWCGATPNLCPKK